MIASSIMVKTAALGAAVALHGALLWGLVLPESTPQTEGASVLAPKPATALAAQAERPTEATKPAPLAPLTPVQATVAATPTQAMTAQPIETAPATVSRRPAQRPKSIEAKAKPAPKPPKPKTPKAGGKKAATKGAHDGKPKAAQKPKSTGTAKTNAAGNAAAKNYPGQVMRKIARVPKPRVGSTGTATVRFTISGSGGLASASVVRSSGASSLDRAALKVIQRAAPFPKPPAGAQRSYTIKIRGAR